MKDFLMLINVVIAVLIVVLILMQGKGSGLGSAWGGQGEMFSTRRGIEKWTLRITVVLIILFFIISVFNLLS